MFDNGVRNLMFDVASGREVFDEEQGRVMSKAECNEAIKKVCFEVLGLNEKSTDKEIKRALKKDSAMELFEVIEEIVDVKIAYGLGESEFFNQFVETRNMADGDRNEFWVDDDIMLTVAKVSGDHHDLVIQRLGSGASYSVPTSVYAVKVGSDIRLFLTGRKDWGAFIDAVAKAFINKIQTEIYSQFVNGSNLLPVPSVLTDTGTLDASNKADFDALIEMVEAANEAPCAIMGTKTALKALNALTIVDWSQPAASIKESVANTGIMGSYEGTKLIAIPQKFTDKTLATPLVDNTKLYIMPLVDDNKPIKFVDYNQTELEVTEIGDYMDDMQTYEVQRRMGIATLMNRYYAVWTL